MVCEAEWTVVDLGTAGDVIVCIIVTQWIVVLAIVRVDIETDAGDSVCCVLDGFNCESCCCVTIGFESSVDTVW